MNGSNLPFVAMINLSYRNIILLALAVSLSGCATTSSKWQDDSNKKIRVELDTAKDTNSLKNEKISQDLSSALLPPLSVKLGNKVIATPVERFNISVKKGKAQDVYLNLVKGTKYSVILDPSIDGKISLKLKNVTLDEVFKHIETSYGYHYEKSNSHYIVYGNKLTTKIFHVDYLNMERGGESGTTASSGGIIEEGNSGVKIKTSASMDFWSQLKLELMAIVGEKDGRGITLNSHSGIIIVRALPGELRLIEDYLKQIQSSITRQVILEAKLLEVDLKDSYQTGINWSQLFTRNSTSLDISQVGGVEGGLVPTFGGVFGVSLQTANFGAFIELISTQGKVHVLSSPRIATVNNQKAVIKVGGEEYFITGVEANNAAQDADGNTTEQAPTVKITPFFSGIALDVTPQIDKDGNIILHLHPTVSNVTEKSKSFVIDGKGYDLPLASSTIRETDTVVRAKNGQIIVVGGLMKQEAVEENAGVPLLGDLPIFGNFFKHKRASRVKKELVVLVKPTLVEDNGTWSNEAASSLMKFSEMRN